MDPVTGISLAASVITVTQFGIDAALKCREIYEHGSLAENVDIESTTDHLKTITKTLQKSMKDSTTNKFLSPDEVELNSLASKCEKSANDLLIELCKVKIDGAKKRSGAQVVWKTSKAIWKKKNIAKLINQLELYRRVLETSLL